MARLTTQQLEAMGLIVNGTQPWGYLLKTTIPSLVKRGLVITFTEPAPPTRPGIPVVRQGLFGPCSIPGMPITRYKLTPAGLEVYVKWRTALHADKLATLNSEFERDLASARARTVPKDS